MSDCTWTDPWCGFGVLNHWTFLCLLIHFFRVGWSKAAKNKIQCLGSDAQLGPLWVTIASFDELWDLPQSDWKNNETKLPHYSKGYGPLPGINVLPHVIMKKWSVAPQEAQTHTCLPQMDIDLNHVLGPLRSHLCF